MTTDPAVPTDAEMDALAQRAWETSFGKQADALIHELSQAITALRAKVAEQQAALDAYDGHGGLWRFWSNMAQEQAAKVAGLEETVRRQAMEAMAREAADPDAIRAAVIAEVVEKLTDHIGGREHLAEAAVKKGDIADAVTHLHMLHALHEAREAIRALIPQSKGDARG